MMNDNFWKHKIFQKKYFNKLELGLYDSKFLTLKRNHLRRLKSMITLGKLKLGQNVLDVGGGTGLHAIQLAEMGIRVTVLDLSERMIKNLNEAKQNELNIKVVIGDAENMPFRDNAFDHTICNSFLHHVPSPLKAIEEMARVTKRGGTVSAAEPNIINPLVLLNTFRYWDIDKGKISSTVSKLKDKFKQAGLKEIRNERIIFVPPIKNEKIMNFFINIESSAERTPIINKFGGAIIISGKK